MHGINDTYEELGLLTSAATIRDQVVLGGGNGLAHSSSCFDCLVWR